MTTDLKEEAWRLAFLVALDRLGLLAMQRDEDGKWLPPSANVVADPEGTRKARRKYRKLWRRALTRQLREFVLMPKRRQKHMIDGAYVRGRWRSADDPLNGQLLKLLSHEVGRRPRREARGHRWSLVKECPELRKTLLKVAAEFGLLDPKRNM